jgi:hypothetical protein
MAVSPKVGSPRVHRLVLLMVAVVAMFYIRVVSATFRSQLRSRAKPSSVPLHFFWTACSNNMPSTRT